jgi:nitroreductase
MAADPAQPGLPQTSSGGLLEGLATTRTIRRYTDDPVDEATLATVLWHATRAPNGSNRQLVRYVVLRDGEAAMKARAVLGEVARGVWERKEAADGYTTGSGADPNSPKARMAATMRHYVDHFHEAPVIVLVCLLRYREPNPYEGASVYPRCRTCCWQLVGWSPAAPSRGGSRWRPSYELSIRSAISACVTLGHPAGHHGPVRRRPLADVVFDGKWGAPAPWAVDPPGTRFTTWR